MTDFDDELASAYLDDAVTAAERARIESDPGLLERVVELRRARDALASAPVAPDATARDAAIRAALDVAVVDLDAARARRRMRVLSIAAAALLIVGVAGFLLRARDGGGSTQASTAAGARSASGATGSSSSAAAATGAAAAGAFPYATNGGPALGSFTDRSALATAVQAAMTSATSDRGAATDAAQAPTVAPSAPGRCAPAVPGDALSEDFAGSALLDGRAVQIDVFTLDDGTRQLLVTASDTCALLFSQSL